MTEFIKYLPEIIAPLIIGGIFTFIFKITALRPQETDYESRFITYYLLGFIIHYIGQSLCEFSNIHTDDTKVHYLTFCISLCIIACISAFLAAKIYRSKFFNKIRVNLGIHDDFEPYYWSSINDIDKGTEIMAYFSNVNKIITGKILYIEPNQRFPQIALCDYSVYFDGEESPIEEHTIEENRLITIDTSKCDYIVLKYNEESRVLVHKELNTNDIHTDKKDCSSLFAVLLLVIFFVLVFKFA